MTQPPAEPVDFDGIVRDTQAHIRAYIAGLGVPRHDVDDIAQDVYVELYRFSDRIPANIPPKQWLKGIARNLCMNYFRRTSRRQRLQREALVEIFLRAENNGIADAVGRARSRGPRRLLREIIPRKPTTTDAAIRAGTAEPPDCGANSIDGRSRADCVVSHSHGPEGVHRQEPGRGRRVVK